MDTIRRSHPLSLVLVLALLVSGAALAAAGEAGLYDQPVLTLDPGMHTAMIRRADVSATGAYAVTGSDDKTVRLWDAQTGRLLRTIRLPQGPGHVGKVYAVAISPDGALVAAGGYTGATGQPQHIYLFDRDTGALVRRLEGLPNVVHHLVFSPTGRYLAATLGGTDGLRVYDRDADWREVARDDAIRRRQLRRGLRRRRAAGDDELWTGPCASTIPRSGAWRRPRPRTAHDPYGLAFTPAGDRLAVGYVDTTAVSLVDGHTLTPLPGPDTRGLDNGNLAERRLVGRRRDALCRRQLRARGHDARWWRGPRPGRAPGASWPPAPTPS